MKLYRIVKRGRTFLGGIEIKYHITKSITEVAEYPWGTVYDVRYVPIQGAEGIRSLGVVPRLSKDCYLGKHRDLKKIAVLVATKIMEQRCGV